MAFLDEHCEDCKVLLGNAWLDVHLWLDRKARDYPPAIYGEYHRTFRHNTWGLTVLELKLGEEAKKAGYIHLLRDYLEGQIVHKGLDTVIRHAKKIMPWWDNCEYHDPYWDIKLGGTL